MKKHALIIIFFLLIIAGRAAGQCTMEGSGEADQTVCEGNAIIDIQYTLTGATEVTSCDLPTGLSYSFTAPVVTITGIPEESGSYSVTLSDGTSSCTSSGNITVSQKPAATAGGISTICVSGSVTVSGASASNGTVSWTASGAGILTDETTLTPTYMPAAADAGTTVTLTMTVTNGPCDDATAIYTVIVIAEPNASAGGISEICGAGSVTISGATSTMGTILWTSDGMGTISDETTLTPTYTAAADDIGKTVTLTMTVTNAPCPDAHAYHTINVRAIPTASAGGSSTICETETVTVSGASYSNGTILWTTSGAGTLTDETTLTPTYDPSPSDVGTSVILTLTVSNDYCSDATAIYTVVVNPLPKLSGASQSAPVCAGNTADINLNGLVPADSRINYTLGSDSYFVDKTITETTTTFTTSRPPFDGETLLITSISIAATGCSTTFTENITMVVNPMPVLTNISLAHPVCIGENATINLEGLLGGVFHTIDYEINTSPVTLGSATISSGVTSFSLGPLNAGHNGKTVTITRIETGDGCSLSLPGGKKAILVVNTPLPPVITGDMNNVCVGASRPYQVEPSMTNYSWTAENGTIAEMPPYGNTVNITWNSVGSQTLSVSYTNAFGCTASSSYEVNVSALPVAGITGPDDVCQGSTGNVYTANPGMTSYSWNVTGGTWTPGESANMIYVTWNTSGSVELTGTSSTGCSVTQDYPVNVKARPVVTIIAGPLYPRVTSSDNEYATQASMTDYEWSLSGGGTGTASGNIYTVIWNETGVHKVFVNYKSSGCKALVPAERIVDVKPLPSVSDVHIDYPDGSPKIGGRLEVDYTYTDGSTGSDFSTYKWYRDATVISTSKIYVAQEADFNKILTCEVTPASTVDPPVTGTPASAVSQLIEDLRHPEIKPVAEEVCIDGKREVNSKLTGKYRYNYIYKPEGSSEYRWIRRDVATSDEVTIGNSKEYTLVAEDLASGKEIYFEITPVSSNYIPIYGDTKRSEPLARIIGLDDQYGISAPDVTLTSNVTGGYFSGRGITGNIFSPAGAGDGTWEINYFCFYEYDTHTCSQRAPQNVVVNPNVAFFSHTDPVYCHTNPKFVVTVSNVPPEAYANTFTLTDPDGIILAETTVTSVTIDPGRMIPGNHKLAYSYKVDVFILPLYSIPLIFRIEKDFIVDKVSTEMRLLGIGDSYCENDDPQYISVENVYPLGGTGTWTGSILVSPLDMSAYLDPGMGEAGNRYLITYSYESPLGCPGVPLSKEVAINPLPLPSFSIDPTYNIEGPGATLVPVQSGGIFSGKGVSGNLFIPSVAGEGAHTITYTIKDSNNCIDSLKRTTTVRVPGGTFSGISDVICYADIDLNISMLNLPANGVDGVVSYTGFSNYRGTLSTVTGATTAVYSLPVIGEGMDTIYFSYVWDNVDYKVKKAVNIDNLGKVEIYDLQQNMIICDDAPLFELRVSKPGGVFTGPVTGGYFDASKAATSDAVTYTFTNSKTGCSIDTVYYVNVYKAPRVDFMPYDICIDHDADTLKFINTTVSADNVVKWRWEFYDEGKMTQDSVREAGYLYLKAGLQRVALNAETDKGCIVRKEKTFDIGRRPNADFYWKKDCYKPGEKIQLFDATSFTTPPKSWSWRSEGTEFASSKYAEYPKTDTGFIRIEYIVRTDYYMCHDTVVRNIYIRPTIPVMPDGYFENFEAGKEGWSVHDTSAIWSFGLPAGTEITSAGSGQNAWFTARPKNGSSAVESPCFDLSLLSRPFIKLMLRKDLDKDRDGAALQYKIGDDPDWRYVGTIGDGIEWYNSATISGSPGGNSLGWTTAGASDPEYLSASHTLDDLKGKKDVKFRIVYGAAGVYSDHDGIAFDDIFIGERSRHVLVEHFMSYSDQESMNIKALVDTVVTHREGDVINIQYHTNLSGIDSIYLYNPGEINTRILFYGLTRVPYSFVDGGTNKKHNMLYDYRSNRIDSNEIAKRTLVDSRFGLYIDPVISGRVLTVKGYIKALEDFNENNLTLFIVVTEKKSREVFDGAPSGVKFLNIFRKFIPDAAGIRLKNSWFAGETVQISEKSWTIEKDLNSSDIEIIAFLQSTSSQEVFQACSVTMPDILVNAENPPGRVAEFSLYPNPANSHITIGFAGPLRNNAVIRIYNVRGEVVKEYLAGRGSTEFFIENPGLKGGLYLVRISMGLFDMGYRKLIVTDRH